jgi:hypothetical protein
VTRSVQWTVTCDRAAPVLTCGGGGAREVRIAQGLLNEVRQGQEDHWSRWIDDEPPHVALSTVVGKSRSPFGLRCLSGKVCTGG